MTANCDIHGDIPHLAFIGPTCVGKTAIVLSLLAQFSHLEVINLDSFQVFDWFFVGTGRSDAQAYGARGHLYGVVPLNQILTPPTYVDRAKVCTSQILARGNIPIFEGGSISYLRAITESMRLRLVGLAPPDEAWLRQQIGQRIDASDRERLFHEIRTAQQHAEPATILEDEVVYAPVIAHLAGRTSWRVARARIVENLIRRAQEQLRSYQEFNIRWYTAGPDLSQQLSALVKEMLAQEAPTPGS